MYYSSSVGRLLTLFMGTSGQDSSSSSAGSEHATRVPSAAEAEALNAKRRGARSTPRGEGVVRQPAIITQISD